MKQRLIATFIFNLIDTVITLIVTQWGFVELNPVTRILLYCPPAFAVVKMAVCTIVVWYLWKHRTHQLTNTAVWILFTLYGLVTLYYTILFFFYL